MTLDDINTFCLNLPACKVRYPFDSNPDLRAWCNARKMFAWCSTESSPLKIQLKAHPELIPMLVHTYEFIQPGYHMNKRHWITVLASECPDTMLNQLLEDAHALVVESLPKRDRLRFLAD